MPFDRKILFTYVILKTLTLFHHFTISPSTISPLRVISLCHFVVFCDMQSHAIMQEFGTLRYLMKYFTSWIFYVWRHVQYCTIRMVTIVTQIAFIVRSSLTTHKSKYHTSPCFRAISPGMIFNTRKIPYPS